MTTNGILQIVLVWIVAALLVKPMGLYMAKVFGGERTFLSFLFRPMETVFYRVFGVREDEDMRWTTYAFAALAFSIIGAVFTYAALRMQGSFNMFGLNPRHFSGNDMTPDLAFDTATSFVANTNWQSYTPESTVSYFTNQVILDSQHWMSSATGVAACIAIIRGFARKTTDGLGNFWVDLTRTILYIWLPVCFVYAIVMVWQGVPQNYNDYTAVKTLEGATQTVAQGPVATWEAIKMIGTNGGGIFNANSAHPFENPNPFTNLLQYLAMFLIPAGLTYTFGRMVGNTRQGWAIFAAMALLYIWSPMVCYWAEAKGNPNVEKLAVMTQATDGQSGGNMEGKETRYGIANSALYAASTTAVAEGAVNSMHDSFTPVGGMVPLINIMCDEVIFGGVGCGLYGMMMYVVVAVFIAGLMIGRTPEYLGKKIELNEIRMAGLAILILLANNVFWTALADNLPLPPGDTSQTFTDKQSADQAKLVTKSPLAALNFVNGSSPSNFVGSTWNNVNNSGAHGFTEILYAYCEATGNNGSAFAGLTANTPFYNFSIAIAFLVGRFIMLIPLLAMAGSLARKKIVPVSAGTLATDTPTFVFMLAGVVLLVGVIEYFPALALGPIVEQCQMLAGKLF